MSKNKDWSPRLAESEEVVSALGQAPKRRASDRLISNFVPQQDDPISVNLLKILKALISLIVAGFVTLGFVSVIMVSTVIATPYIDGRFLVVDRNAWSVGAAEYQDIAYETNENENSLIGKISSHLTGAVSKGSVVRIIATPLDTISSNIEGYVVVNGYPTTIPSDRIIDRKQIGDFYLVECLEGSCGIPGTLYEIPTKNVVGAVDGILKFFKIEEYAR